MLYVAILILLILALFQVTVIPKIPLLNVYPNLVLSAVLAWAMVRGMREGVVGAFIGGLALDLLSSQPLGSHALALLLTIIPIGLLGAPVYRGNLAFPIAGAFLATFLYNLLLMTVSRIVGETVDWGNTFWRTVLPLALVQAILMPLVYWLVDRLDRRLHRRMRIG